MAQYIWHKNEKKKGFLKILPFSFRQARYPVRYTLYFIHRFILLFKYNVSTELQMMPSWASWIVQRQFFGLTDGKLINTSSSVGKFYIINWSGSAKCLHLWKWEILTMESQGFILATRISWWEISYTDGAIMSSVCNTDFHWMSHHIMNIHNVHLNHDWYFVTLSKDLFPTYCNCAEIYIYIFISTHLCILSSNKFTYVNGWSICKCAIWCVTFGNSVLPEFSLQKTIDQ